ncbi:MAG: acyl-CoA carboxylase subunit beta [Brevibacterium sp.]|uniref:acyl-CoA carboxylase subunit beta n=1 Tax=unclassified Brevibacterium TaxID=2614124 RepID=UPI001E58156D|nr:MULTISPECIES: acyl-CoA carboxylase subunit beta [unclassified Brevibacterium]MCD1284414.1 methylmalonyl-CoA carboxyltransferase [Brevibacterium sp. CCUG 69071]MDK8435973.1 acyl-CoA carboxylase subunit beta [Brevibacterium sp. H-BE7]
MTETPRTTAERIDALIQRRDAAHTGNERLVENQHKRGKQTARERIDQLLDDDSFQEIDEFARHHNHQFGMENNRPDGDGVVCGLGTIEGRTVAVFAHDFTVLGGSLAEANGRKIVKVQKLALKLGCPIIGINDSGGARIQEGVGSIALFAEIFRLNVASSGVIPQISLIMGPSAGGAVYSPALTDVTIMVDQISHMYITGPDVIKTVTGENVGHEDLGGGRTNNTVSGNAHYLASDEEDALNYTRDLLSFLPQNNLDPADADEFESDLSVSPEDEALDALMPDSPSQPYDILDVVTTILDDAEFLQVSELFAPNVVTGFGRVEGVTVGVIANQPMQLAGTLDIDASEKAARFVRLCDAFNIPILTFVDVPGFLPGTDQEYGGIIRRGAKLIYAYGEATVPLITLITRKAYGGAYCVMGSKQLGADINLAWPSAQIAVMGAQGAANIVYRRKLKAADEAGEDVDALRDELIQDYEDALLNPYLAAEEGYIDAVIKPSESRNRIVRALRALKNKHVDAPARKHGNIPL